MKFLYERNFVEIKFIISFIYIGEQNKKYFSNVNSVDRLFSSRTFKKDADKYNLRLARKIFDLYINKLKLNVVKDSAKIEIVEC